MTTETTTTTETTVAPKAAAKKAVKKVSKSDAAVKQHANAGNTSVKTAKKAAKKSPAKATKPKATTTEGGNPRSVSEKAKAMSLIERNNVVLKAMRNLGCIAAASAQNKAAIGKACGFSEFDVHTVVYHNFRLQTEGFIKQVNVEGIRGSAFYLTTKGQKHDVE